MSAPGLAAALHDVLTHASRAKAAWPSVLPVIEAHIHKQRGSQELADLRQDVCLKLLRSRAELRDTSDAAANGYLGRVVSSVIHDHHRRQRVRPQRVRSAQHDDIDYIAALPAPVPEPDVWSQRASLLEALKERVRAEIEHAITSSGEPARKRELAWRQAQSTLLTRVDNLDAKAAAAELGCPEVSSACIHKWVERGRPIVLAAIEALVAGASAEERALLENLRAAIAKRRKDAGAARPTRRKPPRRAP